MSTTLLSLSTRVQRLIGDTDVNNYRWESADLMNALADSIDDFNADVRLNQEYGVLGTSNSRYYDPDPTALHKNALVCFAGLYLLAAEKAKAAREAISYSNSAGSTNLTAIASAIDDSITNLTIKLDKILNSEGRYEVEEDMDSVEITTQG